MFSRYGLECLFRFYSYGIEKKFRQELFDDFQTFTLDDFKIGQLYGLEKFWAFLKYSRSQNSLKISTELQEALNRYKSLEDFRVDVSLLFDKLMLSSASWKNVLAHKLSAIGSDQRNFASNCAREDTIYVWYVCFLRFSN